MSADRTNAASSAGRSSTAGYRPDTAGSYRPDTAASSISSLGPAPNTFEPEDMEGFDEEDEEDEHDAEGVFAFHRPQTGAVSGTGLTSPETTSQFDSFSPSTSQFTYSSEPPTTASTTYKNNPSAPSLHPSLPNSDYLNPFPSTQKYHARFKASESAGTVNSDDYSLYSSKNGNPERQAIRMRSFTPLIGSAYSSSSDDGKSMDSSRMETSNGTWITNTLDGVTTVPDGVVTKAGQGWTADEKGEIQADIFEEDSPYPEVNAAVSNLDDPDMPVSTFRSWLIGLTLGLIGAGINIFLSLRGGGTVVSGLIIQIIGFPLGKIMAKVLPIRSWEVPRFLGGGQFSFNPGPFNIKEHTLIVIIGSITTTTPYTMNAIIASETFWSAELGAGFEFLMILCTHTAGLFMAGLATKMIIEPASMIWPQNLSACSLLNIFHAGEEFSIGNSRFMSRFTYFWVVFTAIFVWEWFPSFIFGGLGYFSWICWIAPNNVVVNQLFGSATGLGMSLLSFDWGTIGYMGNPLLTPWWAEANMGVGFLLFYWIIVPILYYTNAWNFAYLPINSNSAFDRFGDSFGYSNIVYDNMTLDLDTYSKYSPIYLTATFMMSYTLAFAVTTCILVHFLLFHGQSFLNLFKRGKPLEPADVHSRLMEQYKPVPMWWYLCFGIGTFAFGIAAVQGYTNSGLPVWGVLLSLLIALVYYMPYGVIVAQSNVSISVINVIGQIVGGYLLPGMPVAGMFFKSIAVESLITGSNFSQMQKLGHYLKIPPRITFTAQLISVLSSAIVQVGVKRWIFATVPDTCSSTNSEQLTCPQTQTFFTASITWGLVGPARQFGPGALYHPEWYCMIIGAVLPIPLYFWLRKRPTSWIRNINFPILIGSAIGIPPSTGINYTSFVIVGFIFQYLIRRKRFLWWSNFNYITAAALDSGTFISIIIIFLTLNLPKGGTIFLDWWGNNVFQNTLDWAGTGTFKTAPVDGFGPATWPT